VATEDLGDGGRVGAVEVGMHVLLDRGPLRRAGLVHDGRGTMPRLEVALSGSRRAR
jgi:hypothetical protein